MEVGYITGTVSYPEEDEVLYESHGEKYYLANINCNGHNIPVSISMYLADGVNGRYRLIGSMANTHRRVNNTRKLFTYFRVLDIEGIGDDVEDKNEVRATVQLAEDVKYTVNKSGKVIADFSAHVYDDKDSPILHFQGAGPIARRLKRKHKNDIITVTGHVIQRRNVLRILVDDFEVKEATENGEVQESAAND